MMNFKVLRVSFFIILSMCFCIHAHEGHHGFDFLTGEISHSYGITALLEGIGRFHLIFLHFPIALIVMTVVAEWLWIWFANPVFSHAARFMVLSAAVFAVPTAFLGLAFGYAQNYEGLSLDLYVWHRYFGFLTAGLAVLAAILRERQLLSRSSLASYYICLFLLFLSVSLTGAFGGSLTFGLSIWS